MGLIKTAMYSGAAMYGVNQISKAVSSRNTSPAPPAQQAPPQEYRREYDRQYDSYRPYPADYRERQYDGQYMPPPHGQERAPYYNDDPRQRQYLDDRQPNYAREGYNAPPHYGNASDRRSSPVPAQHYLEQGRPHGFVEPGEINERSEEQGMSGTTSGLLGDKKTSKKEKDSSLVSK